MVAAYIRIHGERFGIEICDDGCVRLRHPEWSIIGIGPDLAGAKEDVFREARGLGEVMADMDPAKLSPEAFKMRTYALGFVPAPGAA